MRSDNSTMPSGTGGAIKPDSSIPTSTQSIVDYVLQKNLNLNKEDLLQFGESIKNFSKEFSSVNSTSKNIDLNYYLFGKASDADLNILTEDNPLAISVPTGFLILHNDITDLIKFQTTNGNGSSAKFTTGNSSDFPEITLADIAKIVLSNKGGAKSVIAKGTGMTAKAFAPAIANLGKIASFITNPAVLATAAAAAAVALVANYIKNSEQREAEDHMKHLMNEFTMAMTLDDLKNNKDAIKARNDSFVEYLKSYYKSQIRNMKMESFLSGITGAIGSAVKSLVLGMFDKLEKSPFEKKVKELTELLDVSTDAAALAIDKNIINIRNEAFLKYVELYYDSQIKELKAKGEGNELGTKAGATINSFFTSIFDNKKQNTLEREMILLIDTINENINDPSKNYKNADFVLDVQKESISEYIRIYYKSMADALADENASVGWANSFKSFFTTLFGNKDEISNKDVLKSIIDISDFQNSKDFDNIKKDALNNFIKVYYNKLLDNTDVSKEALNSSDLYYINTSFTNSVESIIKNTSSTQLYTEAETGISSFMNKYFESINNNTDFGKLSTQDISEINYAFKNAVKKALSDNKTGINADTIFNTLSNKDSERLMDQANEKSIVDGINTIKTFIIGITEKINEVNGYLKSITVNTATPAPSTVIPIPIQNTDSFNLEV